MINFKEFMKKVLYILLGLAVVGIIVYVIFYYNTSLVVKSNPQDSTITIDQKAVSSGQKSSVKPGTHEVSVEKENYIAYHKLVDINFGSDKIIEANLRPAPVPERIVNKQSRFATLSLDNSSLYYLSDKTMYAAGNIDSEDLTLTAISPDFFTDITDIIWSPNQQLAVIKQPGKTSLYNFKRYDLLHQEITPFNDEGIKDTVWSSDSEHIIYYYEPGTGEKTLVKSTPTNSDKEIVYNFKDTNIVNPKIDWSADTKNVLMVSNNKIYILNLYTNSIKVISGDENVIEAKFMPNNQIIAVTRTGVYAMDQDGQSKVKLDFNTDLKRITFIDADNIIISEKIDNIYKFYSYNLINNDKIELVYNQQQSVNPTDNILTSDGTLLYFESNNYIYRMAVDYGNY